MKRLVLFFVCSLLTSSAPAQETQRIPDACQLITAGDINRLLGTIVKYEESTKPGLLCPFISDDKAVEVSLEYQTLGDIAKAEALLNYYADSLKLQIANTKPIDFTAIHDFDPAGKGANCVVGTDALRGSLVQLKFVIDKHLITLSTVGVPVETVTQNLPEIYRIIKRNSAL
jgi:hypothetical protein